MFLVKYSKAQIKIQEMAFVLIAIMVFFAIVFLFFLSIRFKQVEDSVLSQRQDEAQEIVRKIASTPEFNLKKSSCSVCLDLDKIIALKDKKTYQEFWNLNYLAIEKIYPVSEGECTKISYPDCKTITLVNSTKNIGSLKSSFVALCYLDTSEFYHKCELGKIYASGRGLE